MRWWKSLLKLVAPLKPNCAAIREAGGSLCARIEQRRAGVIRGDRTLRAGVSTVWIRAGSGPIALGCRSTAKPVAFALRRRQAGLLTRLGRLSRCGGFGANRRLEDGPR